MGRGGIHGSGLLTEESMAYVGTTPWHGIGVKVEEGLPPQDFQRAASLDWEALKAPLTCHYGPEGSPVSLPVPDRFCLVKSTSGELLSNQVVSDKYSVVQPADAFAIPNEIVEQGGISYVTGGELFGGKKIWSLAKAGTMEVNGLNREGSKYFENYLLFVAGFDGKTPVKVGLTQVTVVCQNTLSMAVAGGLQGEFTIRHQGNARERAQEATRILAGLQDAKDGLFQVRSELATTRMSRSEFRAYSAALLDAVIGAASDEAGASDSTAAREVKLTELDGLFESSAGCEGVTRHDALEATTNWIAHRKARLDVFVNSKKRFLDDPSAQERRFASAFGGEDRRMTNAALNLLTGRAAKAKK